MPSQIGERGKFIHVFSLPCPFCNKLKRIIESQPGSKQPLLNYHLAHFAMLYFFIVSINFIFTSVQKSHIESHSYSSKIPQIISFYVAMIHKDQIMKKTEQQIIQLLHFRFFFQLCAYYLNHFLSTQETAFPPIPQGERKTVCIVATHYFNLCLLINIIFHRKKCCLQAKEAFLLLSSKIASKNFICFHSISCHAKFELHKLPSQQIKECKISMFFK